MNDRTWRVDEPEPQIPVSVSPSLVTMHFLLTALRRRWRVWIGFGCAGMLLGLVWAVHAPPPHVGTVTLLLAHDPSADPVEAQSTDLSLLGTRTLATDVVERLHLQMAPDEFKQSVVTVPASTEVLVLEVSAPDDGTAVARARALADVYLAFRATQIRSQLEALTSGYTRQITSLQRQSKQLSQQYLEIRTSSPGDPQQLSVLLDEQAQLSSQMESARQSIADARLKADAVINSSKVLDPASSKPPASYIKSVALAMATGLIGASAVGVGFVLAGALTSNRLRRRDEVAQALDTPVRISVRGRLRLRWSPLRRTRLPAAALGTLVDALEREVSPVSNSWSAPRTSNDRSGEATRQILPIHLALATVETGELGELVMAHLAARLSAKGLNVFLVDLTTSGGLRSPLDRAMRQQQASHRAHPPVLHRPERVPSLAHEPWIPVVTVHSHGASMTPSHDAWEQADVCLALMEVDPAVGAEPLTAWADEVVVLVAAGRSSAERLRTTSDLIRSAGLRLLFAMMVGTDRTDESPGLADIDLGWRLPARGASPSTPTPGRHV